MRRCLLVLTCLFAPAAVLADGDSLPPLQVVRPQLGARLGEGLVQVSAWSELKQNEVATEPCSNNLAFDSAELNPSTGSQTGGTCVTGGSANTRYSLSANGTMVPKCYRVVEDLQVATPYAGTSANYISFIVVWGPPTPEPLYVLFNTYENFSACGAAQPATGLIDGVVFQVSNSLPAGTYLITIDLCSMPELWVQLPLDGAGAYEVILARGFDGSRSPPTFQAPTASTFARWGTEPARPGVQTSRAFIDYNPVDGTINTTTECVTLSALPSAASACGITAVGVALSIWADPCSTAMKGDANCDAAVNNFDIPLFVAAVLNNEAGYYAAGGTQACWQKQDCWGDLNGADGLENFDIDPFVACVVFLPPPGQPCP